ncbi:MAG: beta-1,6-N-acetylglucosaminyltransferase [Chitinophagaceae bacterium]|nr:beta-1,6-N-acetylglucosaminyltransferase [Chitinophagaceae bacterium]
MFDIVYIILAFDNPPQIKKLISSLNSQSVFFYIHVDRKVDQIPFELFLSEFSNLKFVDNNGRNEISWGDNKMVKSILNLLKLVNENHNSGYCVLLSNNDYPIKSNELIRQYFDNKYGNSFIAINKLDPESIIFNQRLKSYKFDLSKKRKDLVLIPSIWEKSFFSFKNIILIKKIIASKQLFNLKKILFNRKHPLGIVPYWGSPWWAIPIEIINEILEFCYNNYNYVKFHEETFISDEIFFQTILFHLKETGKINTKFDVRCTYMKFKDGESSPEILLKSDFQEIINLPERFLFARKFDSKKDYKILKMIDNSRD